MTKRRKIEAHDHDVAIACIGDCCHGAVTRAYKEMQDSGTPDQFAFDAALTVFRWYHPEATPAQAEQLVSSWVHGGAVH